MSRTFYARFSNTKEKWQFIDYNNDSTFQEYFDLGYITVPSLNTNIEETSQYPVLINYVPGWQLHNFVYGRNSKDKTTIRDGKTHTHRREIRHSGIISFLSNTSPLITSSPDWTLNYGSGYPDGQHVPSYPPTLSNAPPTLPPIITNDVDSTTVNSRTLGIKITNPGTYQMSVIKNQRDKYQRLQKTKTPATQGYPGGYGDYAKNHTSLPYKDHIYICIFYSNVTNVAIKNYFTNKKNRAAFKKGTPNDSFKNGIFKTKPIRGNYCEGYFETGDKIWVYSTKKIGEIIFSGKKIGNEKYITPVISSHSTIYSFTGGGSFTVTTNYIKNGQTPPLITWPSTNIKGIHLDVSNTNDSSATYIVDNISFISKDVTIIVKVKDTTIKSTPLTITVSNTRTATIYHPVLVSHPDVILHGGGSIIVHQRAHGTGHITWTYSPNDNILLTPKRNNYIAVYSVANKNFSANITIIATNARNLYSSITFNVKNTYKGGVSLTNT